MRDDASVLKGAIDVAFTPAVGAIAAALDRVEAVVKHGNHDQRTHGRRRGQRVEPKDDTGKPIDRDRLYQEYVASTDREFDLMGELKQASGKKAAELQRRLDAQTKESRRLWTLYRTSEPDDSVAKHGSGDQKPHGRRGAGNPAGSTPADRGRQAARAEGRARNAAEAAAAYKAAQAAVQADLKELTKIIGAKAPRDLHWGHVGSMTEARRQVAELLSFLRGDEE